MLPEMINTNNTNVLPNQLVRDKYREVRDYTMSLISDLSPEDMVPQSAVFASPVKWHIAHTTWFFEQLILMKYDSAYQVFDPSYNYLFNSYYNTLGQRIERGQRGLITRPSVSRVLEYRDYVDRHMEALMDEQVSGELASLVTLGINHEQQHQELLLTDLKYTFSCNPTYPVYNKDFDPSYTKSEAAWISMNTGIYEIGHAGPGFSYDNEHGRHRVHLEAYQLSSALVTRGEYLEFMQAGGYDNVSYWLDEGWAWRQAQGINSPLYWIKDDEQWKRFSLAGLVDLELEEPVCHLSHFEASAYASWKGCRLPTEFEWEAASDGFTWGSRWEWTNSAYLPYPKYKTSPGAIGEYNGKFMSNQMVLRGASIVTSPEHSRHTYRNFFPSATRWQFSGLRLAQDA